MNIPELVRTSLNVLFPDKLSATADLLSSNLAWPTGNQFRCQIQTQRNTKKTHENWATHERYQMIALFLGQEAFVDESSAKHGFTLKWRIDSTGKWVKKWGSNTDLGFHESIFDLEWQTTGSEEECWRRSRDKRRVRRGERDETMSFLLRWILRRRKRKEGEKWEEEGMGKEADLVFLKKKKSGTVALAPRCPRREVNRRSNVGSFDRFYRRSKRSTYKNL